MTAAIAPTVATSADKNPHNERGGILNTLSFSIMMILIMAKQIYKESNLNNGLKIITSENPNSEIVTISFWIKVGARNGVGDQLGYAHFLEHMLMKGSKKYPSVFEVSVAKDRVGAASNAFAGPERIFLFIQVAKIHLEKMFELLADSILNPLLDHDVLENEKKVVLQELNRANDNQQNRLWRLSAGTAFDGHPLSRNTLGSEESINSINLERVKEFYREYFSPNKSAIIVSGGVDHGEIVSLTKEFFGEWQEKEVADNIAPVVFRSAHAFDFMTGKQTHLAISFVGPKPDFRESLLLDVVESFLGYGQSSILVQELRHKKGLIYSVSANDSVFQDANLFYIATSTTKPKEVADAIFEIVENLEKYLEEKEFEEIKEQVVGTILRSLNNPMNEVDFLGTNWRFYDKLITQEDLVEMIRGLRYEEMLSAKNKFLSKNSLILATVGEEDPFKDR